MEDSTIVSNNEDQPEIVQTNSERIAGVSLVNDYDSPWRTQHVNVVRVLQSVLSQVASCSSFREITNITFPAEVCYPFSVLELYAYRVLPIFALSYNINKYKDDPFERLLWYMRMVIFQLMPAVIALEKKPFSPVICEHFVAWIKHTEENYTEFFAEQVSHKPDITALFMRNKTEDISLETSIALSTYLPLIPNHVVVKNEGEIKLNTAYGPIKFSKLVPNTKLCNLMDPRGKYLVWEDSISIEDESNGLKAELEFKEGKNKETIIKGCIRNTKTDEKMFKLKGTAGQDVKMYKKGGEEEEKVLYVFPQIAETEGLSGFFKKVDKEYPITHLQKKQQLALNSCRIWDEVSDCIFKGDMEGAESTKVDVGNAKRDREKSLLDENNNYRYEFFTQTEGDTNDKKSTPTWSFKKELTINKKFLKDMAEKVKQESK